MKRILGLLLCLLLALTLPLSALAQSAEVSWLDRAWEEGRQIVSTFTVSPGEALAEEPAAADLFQAMAVQIIGQKGDLAALSLLLGGQEALSCAFRTEESGIYAQSKSVSNDILFFSWEDLQKGLETLEEEEIDTGALIDSFDSLRDMLLGKPTDISASKGDSSQIWEDVLIQTLGDEEETVQWVKDLQSRIKVTQGQYTDASHDPATEKTELLLTETDILAFVQTSYFRETLRQEIAASDPFLTGDQLDAQVEQALAETKGTIQESTIRVPLTLLTAGEEAVSFSLPITMTFSTEAFSSGPAKDASLDLPIFYHRLTAGETKTHSFQMRVFADYRDVFDLRAVAMEKPDGWEFNIGLDDYESIKLTMRGRGAVKGAESTLSLAVIANGKDRFQADITAKEEENATQVKLDLYLEEELLPSLLHPDAPISASLSQKTGGLAHLLTLYLHVTAQDADERFTALQGATPGDATQPFAMTPEELSAFGNTAQVKLIQSLLGLVSMLPTSVFELFGNSIMF